MTCTCFTELDQAHTPPPSLASQPAYAESKRRKKTNRLQVPPTSPRVAFVVQPRSYQNFEFYCLPENRRVVQEKGRGDELEDFDKVLTDISSGHASGALRSFLVDAYVKGYQIATAEKMPFEGSTAEAR